MEKNKIGALFINNKARPLTLKRNPPKKMEKKFSQKF